jgi:hypothetical protein
VECVADLVWLSLADGESLRENDGVRLSDGVLESVVLSELVVVCVALTEYDFEGIRVTDVTVVDTDAVNVTETE